LNNEFVDPGIN